MNFPIMINKIKDNINLDKMNEVFDLYLLKNKDQQHSFDLNLINESFTKKNIYSISFKSYTELFVLLKKDDTNYTSIKEVCKKDPNLRFELCQFKNVEVYILYQLLLNGLGEQINKNNLTGQL